MQAKSKYFLGLTLIAVLLIALYFVVRNALGIEGAVDSKFLIVPAFYFITGLSHSLLVRSMSGDPRKFQTSFITAMGVKMLAYLAFLGAVHFLTGGIDLAFVTLFFFSYLVFTAYEMYALRWYRKAMDKDREAEEKKQKLP